MNVAEYNYRQRNEWLEAAHEDLLVAKMAFQADFNALRSVLFHAQQCVEKAIKTVFIWSNREIVRTHDLCLLTKRVGDLCDLGQYEEDLLWLSGWAIAGRYPGDAPEPFAEDAARALDIAERLYNLISELTLYETE